MVYGHTEELVNVETWNKNKIKILQCLKLLLNAILFFRVSKMFFRHSYKKCDKTVSGLSHGFTHFLI